MAKHSAPVQARLDELWRTAQLTEQLKEASMSTCFGTQENRRRGPHSLLHPSGPAEVSPDLRRLCDRCQTLCISRDRIFQNDGSWTMDLTYEIEDSLPDMPLLGESSAGGCDFCAFLRTTLRRFTEEHAFQIWYDSSPYFCPSVSFTLQLNRIQFYWLKAEWDIYPQYVEGAVIVRQIRKNISFDINWRTARAQNLPDRNPLSESSLRQIRAWISECTKHAACTTGRDDEFRAPSRLLDIGNGDANVEPRLVSLQSTNVVYAALSYCWGQASVHDDFKTLKRNIEERHHKISASLIPSTIRDALSVARALDIRFIWIDLYCILQDDPDDWAKESAKMMNYYEGSYLTIVATRSESIQDGFLQHRPEFHVANIPQLWCRSNQPLYFSYPRYQNHSLDVSRSTWCKRGWTLQERLLSRRLLHFSRYGTWFECRDGWKADGEARSHDDLECAWMPEGSTPKPRLITHSEGSPRITESTVIEKYDWWMRTVREYTQRTLTVPSDLLPAISGLARKFNDMVQDDYYFAGIWLKDFHRGLLWRPLFTLDRDSCRAANRAPSWSWSSVDGGVFWPNSCGDKEGFMECMWIRNIEISTPPGSGDHMGHVNGGKINLEGFVMSAAELPNLPTKRYSSLVLDTAAYDPVGQSTLALLIGLCFALNPDNHSDGPGIMAHGLLLKPVTQTTGATAMNRVGVFELWEPRRNVSEQQRYEFGLLSSVNFSLKAMTIT